MHEQIRVIFVFVEFCVRVTTSGNKVQTWAAKKKKKKKR